MSAALSLEVELQPEWRNVTRASEAVALLVLGTYGDSDLHEFRTLAVQHLGAPDRYVIVNYLRNAIGQERGGHFSPLAAYDADTDRFLVLDVSRYKYPPIWVAADALYGAMNTPDSDNADRTRGFVLVGATP